MAEEREFASFEEEVRRLWTSHGLPPSDGLLGRGSGPVLRQLIGTYTPGDPPVLVAQRAIAADVDARASILAGERAFGTLRREGWPPDATDPVVAPLLDALGVWTGGAERRAYDAQDRSSGVQRIASRLAAAGVLVVREGPVRLCPSCASPRSPERSIYHEQLGDTFLVRFPLETPGEGPPVEALAWVDAPWRVLGATALLVNAELPYVTVEYRRGEVHARLLTLRSSLDRLKNWLPGSELTVLDEQPGQAYVGRRYVYPLRHEFPDGASLPAPSGTVHAAPEVGDSGTGVVPLVPGHGGTDAQIAQRLGVVGWPLLTVRGVLDLTLMHKYSGLDLETANEFVARDLTEAGSVLARLRVLRGVPYCGVCGRTLVWFPGRCWCLEPRHLPPELLARWAKLLPDDRSVSPTEPSAWPVSETISSEAPEAVRLAECERCSRLDGPEHVGPCPCGGQRHVVARRLVTSVEGAFASWSRNVPVTAGDVVRFYVGERRKAPAIVHQLAAISTQEAQAAETEVTVVPSVSDVDLVGLVREYGADAVRSAFVRTRSSEGPGGAFVERCRQEHVRLQRLYGLASSVAEGLGRPEAAGAAAVAADRELQPEDRALLARWGLTELRALAAYDQRRPAEAHHRLARFLEVDLARYREIVRGRLEPTAPPALRRTALRTLGTVVESLATALAPIAPFTAESVRRRLRPDPRSLFETVPYDEERPPPDEELAEAWQRWLAVVKAADRFRAVRRLAPGTVVPSVALVVPDDALADRLRGDRALLERLAGIGRLEVGSPKNPWEGRRRQVVPVESEIQRAYPMLATQIVHLLKRMPQRRSADADARGVSLFVQGQPHQITPGMLTTVEVLPERMVPTPCSLGEMYAELPPGGGAKGSALSADASWLVRRLGARLKSLGPASARSLSVRVVAIDPLAKELREHWAAVAKELGVASLTIDAPSPGRGATPAVTGRTRLGARWSVEIPGLELRPTTRPRPTTRRPRGATRRMPLRQPRPAATVPEVDFSDEEVIRHGDAIRGLGEQLDQLLGAPLLGPAKISFAWDAGYASLEELQRASFDELVMLPGFGRAVAAQLFAKTGRAVPPPPPRPRRERPPPVARPPAPAVDATPGPGRPVAQPPPADLLPLSSPSPDAPIAVAGVLATEAVAERPSGAVARPAPSSAPAPEPPAPIATPPVRPAPALSVRPPTPPPPLEPAFVPESLRPAPKEAPPAPPKVGLELEISEALLPALQPFLEATAAGHRGLAVVRELPERIRTLVGPRPVAVYWMTNLLRDRTVRPGDLPALVALVKKGIEANGISAVFLEGFEYLARIHGSAAIAAFLKDLDQLAREHGARAWLHLTPGLLPASELDRLVADLGVPVSGGPAGGGPTPSA